MSTAAFTFDWSELAFSSKKPIDELRATFVAAPRQLSEARLISLVKTYLPKGNLLLGLAKEDYIDGFAGQVQFRTLQLTDIKGLMHKVNSSSTPHKIYALHHLQREMPFIIEKLKLQKIVYVNGSWHKSFHLTPTYYSLVNRRIPHEFISPFADETEAKAYAEDFAQQIRPVGKIGQLYTKKQMLTLASKSAQHSFDHTFQTGVVLGKQSGQKYKLLATTFNKVVPYQTYAMHHGALRERHFSPANDLNYYDTVHAEVELILHAQKRKLSLKGTTLFINLMPCPTCARMLAESDIMHFVYQHDHSDGYALKLFEATGKHVERSVS